MLDDPSFKMGSFHFLKKYSITKYAQVIKKTKKHKETLIKKVLSEETLEKQ